MLEKCFDMDQRREKETLSQVKEDETVKKEDENVWWQMRWPNTISDKEFEWKTKINISVAEVKKLRWDALTMKKIRHPHKSDIY